MEQSRLLLANMKEFGWDSHKVNYNLLFLPDKPLAEFSQDQDTKTPSFVTPAKDDPDYPGIAFYSTLYFRTNNKMFNGDNLKQNQKVFIVGYKSGQVEKIPGDQVRLTTSKTYAHTKTLTFPECQTTIRRQRNYRISKIANRHLVPGGLFHIG